MADCNCLCTSNGMMMMRSVLHVVLAFGDIQGLDYGVTEVSNQCIKILLCLTNLQYCIILTLIFNSQCMVQFSECHSVILSFCPSLTLALCRRWSGCYQNMDVY